MLTPFRRVRASVGVVQRVRAVHVQGDIRDAVPVPCHPGERGHKFFYFVEEIYSLNCRRGRRIGIRYL
eukprot:7384606-Prymnesium_polylepis.1